MLLAECKDLKDGIGYRAIHATLRQLRRVVELSVDVEARIVLLSTLLPDIPPELAEGVLKFGQPLLLLWGRFPTLRLPKSWLILWMTGIHRSGRWPGKWRTWEALPIKINIVWGQVSRFKITVNTVG